MNNMQDIARASYKMMNTAHQVVQKGNKNIDYSSYYSNVSNILDLELISYDLF